MFFSPLIQPLRQIHRQCRLFPVVARMPAVVLVIDLSLHLRQQRDDQRPRRLRIGLRSPCLPSAWPATGPPSSAAPGSAPPEAYPAAPADPATGPPSPRPTSGPAPDHPAARRTAAPPPPAACPRAPQDPVPVAYWQQPLAIAEPPRQAHRLRNRRLSALANLRLIQARRRPQTASHRPDTSSHGIGIVRAVPRHHAEQLDRPIVPPLLQAQPPPEATASSASL